MPKPRASSRLSLGIARGPVLISLSAAVNFRFKIEGASGIIFSSRFIDKPLLSLSNSKTYSKSPLSENPKAISSNIELQCKMMIVAVKK